ncbi:SseB family protein [Maricaulis sp.]|uniref:SseB family protein n=1 Tax=Maricaulis sp. TaxID=1486257 RepID=UPI0025C51014|nr:SseB family protein [Maricaulis sp.]
MIQRLAGFLVLGVIVAFVLLVSGVGGYFASFTRFGWPDDTVLAMALSEHSRNHQATEGLYPFLARETVYAATAERCEGNVAEAGRTRVSLQYLQTEDGQFYYAFDTIERFNAWAARRSRSEPCYLPFTGAELAAWIGSGRAGNHLIINHRTNGRVELDSRDLAAVAALGE